MQSRGRATLRSELLHCICCGYVGVCLAIVVLFLTFFLGDSVCQTGKWQGACFCGRVFVHRDHSGVEQRGTRAHASMVVIVESIELWLVLSP